MFLEGFRPILQIAMMNINQLQTWNTKERGTLLFLVYGKEKHYIGVCLTLDIVEEGDDPQKLMDSIVESAMGHVRLVQEKNLDDALLNRPAPQEYWDIYLAMLQEMQRMEQKTEPGGYIYTKPITPLVHA